MTEPDDDNLSDDASAEDAAKLSARLDEADQAQRDLIALGWVWQLDDPIKRVLAHPDDPHINIWFHPYTGEQLLSPKLVERLKQQADADRQQLPD